MLDGIDGVLNLAAAGGLDLAESANVVSSNLAAFGLQAEDSAHLVDMMAVAQAASNTSTQQMAEAYGSSATQMTQYGQSAETTTAILMGMAQVGDTGSAAGTRLNAVMAQLIQKQKDGAVAIGDTSVALFDSQGNMRDMIDIMADVEAATSGMSDEQKTAALSAVFNRTSLAGVNEILGIGIGQLSSYKTQLENSDGAAEDMANTMQDNLQGAVTELNSATEGLGVALYNKVSGPMTEAVDTVTGLINGLTDSISGEKTELEQFIDDIETSNDEVQGLIDSADKAAADGASRVAELENYKQIILDSQKVLENGGTLDTFQIYQVTNAVEALSSVMPELSANYDSQTGSINLNKAAIEELFAAEERLVTLEADLAAKKDLEQAYRQAQINAQMASDAVTAAQQAYDDLGGAEAEAALKQDAMTAGMSTSNGKLEEAKQNLDDAKAAQETANAATDDAKKKLEATTNAIDELNASEEETAKATERSTEATENNTQAQEENAEAAEKLSDAQKESIERAKEVAKAANDIADAYDAAVKAAENSIKGDMFSEFAGGEDQTVEQMMKNLDSQIAGYTNYVQNLQTVKDQLGETAPEFVSYLEEMGTEGANTLQHIVDTFSQDNGPELVQEYVDKWTESMNMKESIAKTLAADKLALGNGLKDLGSTDSEWRTLQASISGRFDGLDSSMQGKLSDLIATAQSMGVKIPDGLQSGIESGDVDFAGAMDEIKTAMTDQVNGLITLAESQGLEIPASIRAGMEGNEADVAQAYANIVSLLTGQSIDLSAEGAEADATLGSGIESGTAATDAATSTASAAVDAAKLGVVLMESAGIGGGQNFAGGLLSQVGYAGNAGSGLGGSAYSAASGYISSFTSVGSHMGAGMAAGIQGQIQSVAAAAAALVRAALEAAKRAADVRSPSRKFRDQVGKMIGKGTAYGIKLTTKETTDAAEAMCRQALAKANSFVKKYGKTLGDAEYAYNKLTDKLIGKNFGVSLYEWEGTGDKRKKVKKSLTDFYNDIYDAASKYYSNLNIMSEQSDRDDVEYWTKVRKRLKKGSQAWYDATEKIKQAKQKLGTVSAAEDILDNYQTYFEMSERAEAQYWDTIRKKYKAGTEERIAADKKYFEAKQKYFDKLAEIEENYQTKVQEATQSYTDSLNQRVEAIRSAFGIFDEFTSESLNGEELLANMESQAAGYADWAATLAELEKRGVLSAELISELQQQGPAAAASIHALMSLTDEQLKKYQQAYDARNNVASAQANREMAGEFKELQATLKEYSKERKEQLTEVKQSIDSNLKNIAGQIKTIYEDQTSALVKYFGNSSATGKVSDATLDAVDLSLKGVKTGSALNSTVLTTSQAIAATDLSDTNKLVAAAVSAIANLSNTNIYLDSGALVGSLSDQISAALAAKARRA